MDLQLKIGDDLTMKFTVTDADDTVINLTGGTIKFKIGTSISISDASALYFGEYTTFTDAVNGIHKEVIPDSVTSLWGAGEYRYQARFIDSAGEVISEDVGFCVVLENLIDNE